MKARYMVAAGSTAAAAITKEDLIFIISLIVTVLNLVMSYLERRKTPK